MDRITKFIKEPEHRVTAAWWLLAVCFIGWPVSQFTWASNEPPTTLALSWLAIILTCLGIVVTTDVRREQNK